MSSSIALYSPARDQETDAVIQQLILQNHPYHRFHLAHCAAHIPAQSVPQYKSIWFRKSAIPNADTHLQAEYHIWEAFTLPQLSAPRILGLQPPQKLNKLQVLQYAHSLGIRIPATWIGTSKTELAPFYQAHQGQIITKPLSHAPFPTSGAQAQTIYTERITPERWEAIPDQFGPSFFQEAIEKIFEVRLLYLDGQIFAAALFTQQQGPKTDFRKYLALPYRTVPFSLPKIEQQRLHLLMQRLKLNFGVVDYLVTPQNQLVFLEVNPHGQYEMFCQPCQFPAAQTIAAWLAHPSS